jgi:hypothetical protein
MFDLDAAVGEWRRQLTTSGIRSPEVLDELEGHLREDAEMHQHAGLAPGQAFETAVRGIGQAGLLQNEFAKVSLFDGIQERLRHVIFTLAGIPTPTFATTMNTSQPHIEPWWATYLKGGVFLGPAVILWTLSIIFVFPKLKQICLEAGVAIPGFYRVPNFISEHNLLICAGVIAMLVLLERRWTNWAKYRRMSVGIAVFLVNATVMVLIFAMVVLALLAAPALMHAR